MRWAASCRHYMYREQRGFLLLAQYCTGLRPLFHIGRRRHCTERSQDLERFLKDELQLSKYLAQGALLLRDRNGRPCKIGRRVPLAARRETCRILRCVVGRITVGGRCGGCRRESALRRITCASARTLRGAPDVDDRVCSVLRRVTCASDRGSALGLCSTADVDDGRCRILCGACRRRLR